MQLQVILNTCERHARFVYEAVHWADAHKRALQVKVRPRKRSQPLCSKCGVRGRGYDRLPERWFQHVPLWGLTVWLRYAPRRVDCHRCGVTVERLPWASGKEHTTTSFQWFLARWAKRLSWRETAAAFGTNWQTVFAAVKRAVCWGLRHRDLTGVTALGVDEVAYRKGHRYLTLVYQIDGGSRRLLWIGLDRTKQTLQRFFRVFGKRRTRQLQYLCSDMWRPYLSVIAREANQALHVLDRFHIMQQFNKVIDQVRAAEHRRMQARGLAVLKNTRWLLLKRRGNLHRREVFRLKDLLAHNLQTVKCYLMREDFQRFWGYTTPWRIASFFVEWVERAKRTQIAPMRRLARTLERHAEPIFNWFEAKGTISAGAVEGMNLKVKLTTRRAYGFRNPYTLKYALYHNLGHLSEPEFTHKYA